MSKKKDKERMEYLKGILFDENGDVLEYAEPADVAELAELMEQYKEDDKPKPMKKVDKVDKVMRTPCAQGLIDQGCEYLGTDGISEYLYKIVKQPGYQCGSTEVRQAAIIVTAGQAWSAGMKFSDDLLAKLIK